MRIDSRLDGGIADSRSLAQELEEEHFAGAWTAEAGTDPFLPLAVAAVSTKRIQLGTNIAVAFARSPMTVAASANDLQRVSEGRMILGLGSQVRPHIERRYGMPWSQPAARMREYVEALHAIWSSWNEGARLNFTGEFYTHTLMTPYFAPDPHRFGPPQIFLAAVGPAMTRVAAVVCDGLLVHPFTSERYLREVTLPAVEKALAEADRPRNDFQIACNPMVVTGDSTEEMERSARRARREVAFHASTPAYVPVLELHGWGGLQPELNRLSKLGAWRTMTDLVTDEMLETFAVIGSTSEMAKRLVGRFGGVADRIAVHRRGMSRAGWEWRLPGTIEGVETKLAQVLK